MRDYKENYLDILYDFTVEYYHLKLNDKPTLLQYMRMFIKGEVAYLNNRIKHLKTNPFVSLKYSMIDSQYKLPFVGTGVFRAFCKYSLHQPLHLYVKDWDEDITRCSSIALLELYNMCTFYDEGICFMQDVYDELCYRVKDFGYFKFTPHYAVMHQSLYGESPFITRNGRIYSKELVAKAMNKYLMKKITMSSVYGEIGHP